MAEPEPEPLVVKARALREYRAVLEEVEERKPTLRPPRVLVSGFRFFDEAPATDEEMEVAAAAITYPTLCVF